MSRTAESPVARILHYFRDTDLPIAAEIWALVQDVMKERRQRSQKAQARALAGTAGPRKPGRPPRVEPVASAPVRRRQKTRAKKVEQPAFSGE